MTTNTVTKCEQCTTLSLQAAAAMVRALKANNFKAAQAYREEWEHHRTLSTTGVCLHA
jgi:hypothetical protein